MTARAAAMAVLAAACVPKAPRDRQWLDMEISRRTGHGIGPGDPAADTMPPGVSLADGLTEDEAVAIALWRNADIQADLARLGLARADLIAAGLPPNPTLTAFGPKNIEVTLAWGLGWLLLRPHKVRAARLEMMRVAEELVQRALDLARDVRVAHAAVLAADRRVTLSTDALHGWEDVAALTEKRWRAGDIGRAGAEAARSQAATTSADLATQRTRHGEAQARLAELVGMSVERVTAVRGEDVAPPAGVDRYLGRARRSRPDLRAAKFAIEAATARAGIARAKAVEFLNAIEAKYTTPPSALDPGIDINLLLFDRGQAERARAKAEIAEATWRYVAARRTAEREVSAAHAGLAEAVALLAAWRRDVVTPAEAALGYARQQFEVGDESYLVVLDAARRLEEARLREADLDEAARRARAELERAAGGAP